MLKKCLTSFIFAIFIFVSLYTNICYAAPVKVTKENLTEAFQKFVSSEANEDSYSISVVEDIIKVTADKETYTLKYDLTGKPIFSLEIPIEEGMSYADFKKKTDNLSLPWLGYIAVANIQGAEFEDSSMYFLLTFAEKAVNGSYSSEDYYVIYDDLNLQDGVTLEKTDPKTIYTSEFGDRVMEYVNALYPETQTISDSDEINSYVMTIEKKDIAETSCKLVYTLSVNTDADFSNIKGYLDKLDGEDTTDIKGNDSKEDKINNKEEANIQKLPQTGEEKNIYLNVLYAIIGVCSISLIAILYKSKKTK